MKIGGMVRLAEAAEGPDRRCPGGRLGESREDRPAPCGFNAGHRPERNRRV